MIRKDMAEHNVRMLLGEGCVIESVDTSMQHMDNSSVVCYAVNVRDFGTYIVPGTTGAVFKEDVFFRLWPKKPVSMTVNA